jgi:hypothetical protein
MAEEPRSLEERRKNFIRVLKEQNPKLADLYAGAVRLVEEPTVPGRATFIAHAGRELKNVIPRMLVPGGGRSKPILYHKELAPIVAQWNAVRTLLQDSENSVDRPGEIPIPRRVAEMIDKLIGADQAVGPMLQQRVIAMCARVTSDASGWAGNEALAKQWTSFDFEELAHIDNGEAILNDEDTIAMFLEFEEIALHIFDYGPERLKTIIDVAESATPDNLEAGLRKVVTFPDEFVFYGHLRGGELLPRLITLRKLELTDSSPLYWPQAEYLANIAAERPREVANVLIELRTNRPGTVRSLLSVALKLPDDQLIRVARSARWLRAPGVAFLEQYVTMVKRVGEAGDTDQSFNLAGRALKVKGEAPAVAFPGVEKMDAVVEIGDWLEFLLKLLSPVLFALDAGKTIELFADTLNTAVLVEEDENVYPGYSGWFENLLSDYEPHHGTKRILTAALRDRCVELAKTARDQVYELLERPKNVSGIYTRIAYACVFHTGDSQRASVIFDKSEAWVQNGPEHLALVERFFGEIPEQERAEVAKVAFDSVEAYFVPLLAERGIERDRGAEIIRQNIVERFGTAAAAIPEPYASRLIQPENMKPEPPRELPTLTEMQALSPAKLAELLHLWQPTDTGPLDGTWSIGANLNVIVRADAANWLSQRDAFNQIPLYYLGWALNALQTYRRETQGVDDDRLLTAVEDVLARLEEPLKTADVQMLGIAQHIAQSAGVLLENIVMSAKSEDFVTRIVSAAGRLAQIPTDDSRAMRRTQFSAPNDSSGDARGLSALIVGQALSATFRNKLNVSEIESLYDELTLDQSLPTRAACGRYFDWFARIYPEKATNWKTRLFQCGNENADKAAWNGYVSFLDINLNTYRLLSDVYTVRVGELAQVEDPDDHGAQSHSESIFKKQTIHHIWLLLANRIEEIGVEDSLAEKMLRSASLEQIKELLSDVPGTLHDDKIDGGQNQKVNAEAMRLWEAVEKRVDAGKMPQGALSSAPLWLKAPLPHEWRFALAERAASIPDHLERNDWALVPAFIDLAQYDREHALRLLERVARTGTPTALANIQMNAGPLLRESLEGSDNEKHLAQSINSVLVNNGRPNLLDGPRAD